MTITKICAALEALEDAREKASRDNVIAGLATTSDVADCDIRNFPISFRKIAEVVRAAEVIIANADDPEAGGICTMALRSSLSALDEVKP